MTHPPLFDGNCYSAIDHSHRPQSLHVITVYVISSFQHDNLVQVPAT